MPDDMPEASRVQASWDELARAFAPAEIELTILMPCLNEAETLAACIDKAFRFIERAGIAGEVLVADNNSTDGSREIARLHGARVIPIEARGYGAALIGGIEAARGRFVVMGDSDDSYDFSNLDAFLAKLRDGYELVMGNRFRGGIAEKAMPPLHRYLGNPVLSFVGRLFFRSDIGDFHCGLRGFSRQAILGLRLTAAGMEFASEMVVKATLAGLRVAEVPTILSPDGRSRPPHLRSWRDGWRHLKLLLIFAPHWLFLYPGRVLASMGALLAAALLPGPIGIGGLTLDTATLLFAVAAIMLGMQMVLFYAVARIFAGPAAPGMDADRFRRLEETLAVDRLCLVGGGSFAIGVLLAAVALLRWIGAGLGDLDEGQNVRLAATSTLAMALGIQTVTTAFLIGLAQARRNSSQRAGADLAGAPPSSRETTPNRSDKAA